MGRGIFKDGTLGEVREEELFKKFRELLIRERELLKEKRLSDIDAIIKEKSLIIRELDEIKVKFGQFKPESLNILNELKRIQGENIEILNKEIERVKQDLKDLRFDEDSKREYLQSNLVEDKKKLLDQNT
ncbi:MAG TPA: hypothetical protein ENO30_06730 [Thermodesulfobium narugense]|uniref:Uncharacterized protein n=1 Tax=Thermodesulfobium acidiphilum TaxID=1794699 RepID=A0A2R4VYE1_THEAF|nr:hypothetical protein [Thermodesulfobium acidiphilum]AWB09547.1 hypothetical protein TDSAC_0160 [Thermodesulfobium acidiphilum]HEM56433.1 hypothetical protein [Thermodesulfobium narugense]